MYVTNEELKLIIGLLKVHQEKSQDDIQETINKFEEILEHGDNNY